ncbi:uncharacterized protein LOC144432936 [Glandiceps talaboti]
MVSAHNKESLGLLLFMSTQTMSTGLLSPFVMIINAAASLHTLDLITEAKLIQRRAANNLAIILKTCPSIIPCLVAVFTIYLHGSDSKIDYQMMAVIMKPPGHKQIGFLLLVLLLLVNITLACLQNCTCKRHGMTCNNITTLPDSIPRHITSVVFHQAHCSITSGVFDKPGYSNVATLAFTNGRFDVIDSDAFVKLTNIKTLKFIDNVILLLQPDAFDNIPSIHHLQLSGNNFKELTVGLFQGLSTLTQLDFVNHQVLDVKPNAFRGLENLKVLSLSNNQLKSISDDRIWNGLHSLEELYLSNNKLDTIADEVFSPLNTLKVLDLTNNSLAALTQAKFAGLNKLETLTLKRNPLHVVPRNALRALPALQTLNLYATDLTGLAANSLEYVPHLQSLVLDYNRIDLLPVQTLQHLPQLKRLSLKGTRLTTLPENGFSNLTQLQWLSITRSGVKLIEKNAFHGLSSLESLDLSRNHLTSLPPKIFRDILIQDKTVIALSYNSWFCDCHFKDFTYASLYFYSNVTLHKVFKDLICQSPPELKDMFLWEVPADNFTCAPPAPKAAMSQMEINVIIGSVLGSAVVVAVVAVGGVKHYKKKRSKERRRRQHDVNLVTWDDNSEDQDHGEHTHEIRSTTSAISL